MEMTRAMLCCLCICLAFAILSTTAAHAQAARLETMVNWDYDPIALIPKGGAPANGMPVASMTAHYNWGYGMTMLGLNLQVPGETRYYAACTMFSPANGAEVLDAIGPFTSPVEWHSGPYHVAAAMPEGLICVWLTAPGHFPSRVLLAGDYMKGTAFTVDVVPPRPLSTDWSAWRISIAYQRFVSNGRYLTMGRFNGNGRAIEYLTDASIPGDLLAIDYLEYPVTGGTLPFVLLTVSRNEVLPPGSPRRSTSYAAFYSLNRGWVVQTLRDGGLYNGRAMLMNTGDVIGLLGVDNSTIDNVVPALQQVRTWVDSGQIFSEVGTQTYLPFSVERQAMALANSTLSMYPLVAVTNGTDVDLGYYLDQEDRLFEYRFFELYRGNVETEGSMVRAAFPIYSVATATHWSSGYPELFWIQQDILDPTRTGLYRMAYGP